MRDWADLFLIAPLSANSLAKISSGLCDNLLTCVCRAWPLGSGSVLIRYRKFFWFLAIPKFYEKRSIYIDFLTSRVSGGFEMGFLGSQFPNEFSKQYLRLQINNFLMELLKKSLFGNIPIYLQLFDFRDFFIVFIFGIFSIFWFSGFFLGFLKIQ